MSTSSTTVAAVAQPISNTSTATTKQQQQQEKPSIGGFKDKTRKRVQAATAKLEPEVFRDTLFEAFQDIKSNTSKHVISNIDDSANHASAEEDSAAAGKTATATATKVISTPEFAAVAAKLDKLGAELDYRRYSDRLFEVLLFGDILESGGVFASSQNGRRSPYYLMKTSDDASAEDDASVVADAKQYTELLYKVIRRYKYLQKSFEEVLERAVQLLPRWSAAEQNRLAAGVAYMCLTQLANLAVLATLFKDHLTKDGQAIGFAIRVFKYYSAENAQLGIALDRLNLNETQLINLLPVNQRSTTALVQYFTDNDLPSLAAHIKAKSAKANKQLFIDGVTAILEGEEHESHLDHDSHEGDEDDVAAKVKAYVSSQANAFGWNEVERVTVLWDALIASGEWNVRPDQIAGVIDAFFNTWSPVLHEVAGGDKAGARVEIAIMQHVQVSLFDHLVLAKYFARIVQLLYKHDVVSGDAILFWHSKGAKPQGKAQLTKALDKFVEYLEEDSDDEDDDEEDDE
ncbi:hypothetical protein GQ42DRAFT_161199 [Ramicandelaber brevisporus]|nr:hypothetical protein GQ42DRAFT_161199 [Ramicandelaber brevisporus]